MYSGVSLACSARCHIDFRTDAFDGTERIRFFAPRGRPSFAIYSLLIETLPYKLVNRVRNGGNLKGLRRTCGREVLNFTLAVPVAGLRRGLYPVSKVMQSNLFPYIEQFAFNTFHRKQNTFRVATHF